MPRYARNTDPQTSHEAAASTTEKALSRLETMVLAILENYDAADEALVTKITASGYPASPQGIRTARVALARRGLIEVVGEGVTKYGRKCRIWGTNL